MAVVRKKQDDKYLKALRELVTSGPGNRQCFDCGQKGPTYVNMTIGSFVCTRCSGVLRGLTPPHRIKSISMATFTQEEIDFLKAHGNELCAKTWLGLWDPKRAVHQDQRELMIDKYERKRYYLEPASPLKSLTNAASLKSASNSSTAIAAATTTSTSATNLNNNNNNLNNLNGSSNSNGLKASNHQTIDNGFHSIQLTPPQSQRTTANGLHKSSSSSVVSRPQHHLQQQNHNGFHHDAFGVAAATANGVLSSTLNASIGSSTGALSDTSSCASANGFGGDSDFVADFGSANIFDATSAGSVGSPAVSSASSVASSNGYAKIQPILTAQHQFMNGNSAATTENFADFDHAPIYNAAGKADANVFLKCGITRRSSSDVIFSESTSNFTDPFDDFTEMVTRHEPKADERPPTKFTPLAMAAHATAMAVLGSSCHYNNGNNPFERPAGGAAVTSSASTAPTPQWPTLWEESADELAASGECATPTNEPASAANTPSPCQNSFGYSLLMNGAFHGDVQQHQATPTFSTYLPHAAHQPQQHEQSSAECEQIANFSNFCTNCRVASQPCSSSSSVQTNSNTSHCCRAAFCCGPPDGSTPSADQPPPGSCCRARPSTNPFLPDFHMYDDNCYYDNCYAHQNAVDDYMQKFNNFIENINYNQCSLLNASDDCFAHATHNTASADATTTSAAMPSSGGGGCGCGCGAMHYEFADATAVNSTATSSSTCSSCATTNNYSYTNTVCNQLTTSSRATETATTSCYTSSSTATINNNLNNQNQTPRTTENCGTQTRTTELRSTDGTTAPSTVDANSNCCDKSFSCCPLPIPNGIHKGMSVGASSPGTQASAAASANNNNNNLSSTPTQDRYAALKDLDEQLRESKAVAAAAASIVATNVVDSFGQQSHHLQQQQPQQNGMVVNPFQQNQQAVNAAAQQQLYGQMTVIPNGYHHLHQQQQQQLQQQGYFNFNAVAGGAYNGQATVLGGGPNGCGFGFGAMQQQINANGIVTNGGGGGTMMMATNGAFNNPFAATGSMNSNNPFL